MKSKFDEYFLSQFKAALKHTRSTMLASVAGMILSVVANVVAAVSVLKDHNYIYIILGVVVVFVLPAIYRLVTLRNGVINIKSQYPGLSVVGIMSLKKEGRSYFAISILVTALMLYMAYSAIAEHSISIAVITVSLLGAGFVLIREKIYQLRIKKGFFGNNESEAREIINFILSNSDNIDFTDGGKRKSVFSKEEIEGMVENAWNPSTVGV